MRQWIIVIAALVGACSDSTDDVIPDDGPVGVDAAVDAGVDADVCAPVVDQMLGICNSPPVFQCTVELILFSGQSAAQVFSPTRSGRVDRLRLRMANLAASTNPVQVSIIDLGGDPQIGRAHV